mgnify:CR=1 FL=1
MLFKTNNNMNFLYTAGTARGGTNYRTLILNNHSKISMSIDPLIPLFHYYKKSLLSYNGRGELLTNNYTNVIDDYFFDHSRIEVMKAIQESNPDVPFDMSGWSELKIKMKGRMSLASANLIPYLDEIPAPTFKEVFQNVINIIERISTKENLEWVGFNDNWTIEFFPLIAQLFPKAKFMIHLRDPRAVVCSSEFAEPDPNKRPTILSFARHLRKYYAFVEYFKTISSLKGRLLVTYYESFIDFPEQETKKALHFLGLDYEPQTININLFRKATGEVWPSSPEVYKSSINIWETQMPSEMAELVEFICSPDMQIHGYTPKYYNELEGLSDNAYKYALDNFNNCLGWRTDFGEFSKTLGCEFNRKRLLMLNNLKTPQIEENFLFKTYYNKLKNLKDE